MVVESFVVKDLFCPSRELEKGEILDMTVSILSLMVRGGVTKKKTRKYGTMS